MLDEEKETTNTSQAESVETDTPEESEVELTAKEYVLDRLTRDVEDFTGKKPGAKTFAKRLLQTFTEAMFQATSDEKYFRFGGGFGALKVKTIAATKRRVPATGAIIDCPARNKVVYVEGKTTKALVNIK